MKLSNSRLIEIENYLNKSSIVPIVSNELVVKIFEELIWKHSTRQFKSNSLKSRKSNIEYLLDSIKRDLLKLQYKVNGNSAKGIDAGYVYLISNPAWPGLTKIGSAIDVDDRLRSYQTYSPFRDYKLEKYFLTEHRIEDEKLALSMDVNKLNEWVNTPLHDLIKLMKQKRDSYRPSIKLEWLQ